LGGLPSFIPGGQFAFPRSYVKGITVRHDGAFLSWDGELLQWIVAGPPDALVRVTFDSDFAPWSSNRWTLDHITTDATYEYPPNPTRYPLPYYIIWHYPDDIFSPHILLDAMYGADYTDINLPVSSGGYWLPPYLS
jgi:hypothetical protein